MADNGEPGGGCLSALSCFKKRGKKRLEVSRSPKRAPVGVSPAPDVAGSPASKAVTNQVPASTSPRAETTVSTPVESRYPRPQASKTSQMASFAPYVSARSLNLWQEAYAKVDHKTRKWIDSIAPMKKVDDVKDAVHELVELVRCSEEEHSQEALKLKVGDREILWRDYANRVVSLITAIGDIAVAFAPAPSSTVWSAIKVLLAANVSQCEDLVAIMGCTDVVLCLVRRGSVYEEVYINKPTTATAQKDLQQKLIKVNVSCLEFLAFVNEKMQQGNLGRFLDALLDPGHGEQRLSEIKALELELDFAARFCEAKESDEHRKLLRSLEGPLKRVDSNVTKVLEELQSDERRKAMEYISVVPVGSYHNEKRESRTRDTCEWLVAHPKFLEWEGLPYSSVFWLQGRRKC
ncbi:unnamed protein product [Colletotrichum noveboracense]|uniref:NWD NACHT-NTPase N-terminal domain-containing protein n=1 Tax=Colletotrichum noveboracense TaxID=2664923 RepID=A0A9W4S720_9PEZI|nr:unnamed protein product [Colletotrichum noveboracense]